MKRINQVTIKIGGYKLTSFFITPKKTIYNIEKICYNIIKKKRKRVVYMNEKMEFIDFVEMVDPNCELSEDELKIMYELNGGVL